jgi:glycosyltransferase involved in cell wall biosynthesis
MISIVTSTLNAAAHLSHTLRSVAQQRGASFEWIVVDGGSTDGTVDLLRQNDHLIAHWLSEPDGGIYDAWNKACALARGEWLLFIGAGDAFTAPDTLASFCVHLESAYPAHDLVYGKLRYISPGARVDLEEVGAPWEDIEGRWELCRPALPPHPAIFHHRSLFADGRRFDTRFKMAGDSHFLLRHALRKRPLFVPAPLLRAPVGGVSLNLRTASALAREISDIDLELGLVPPLRHRLAERLRLGAKVLAGWIPPRFGHPIADCYRRLTGQPKRWSTR